jgi:hypothetical protein
MRIEKAKRADVCEIVVGHFAGIEQESHLFTDDSLAAIAARFHGARAQDGAAGRTLRRF